MSSSLCSSSLGVPNAWALVQWFGVGGLFLEVATGVVGVMVVVR